MPDSRLSHKAAAACGGCSCHEQGINHGNCRCKVRPKCQIRYCPKTVRGDLQVCEDHIHLLVHPDLDRFLIKKARRGGSGRVTNSNAPEVAVGDRVIYGGDVYRILSIVPGRMDPIVSFDTADIEGVNDQGDVGLFGFEDVEGMWKKAE